jgi:hypothetical protein
MHPNPLRTDESIIPKESPPGETTPFLPILITFLIGFSAAILYSTMVALGTISLGALAGLFILPPVVGNHAFATPTDSPRAKHIAFFTIVFAELASCAALYFHWKSIPIPKFSSSNLLYWPFVRTHNDGYVGDVVWNANQCFLAGVIASYLAILAYPRIKKSFDSSPRSV